MYFAKILHIVNEINKGSDFYEGNKSGSRDAVGHLRKHKRSQCVNGQTQDRLRVKNAFVPGFGDGLGFNK
jgi:hypothetical protein